MAISQATFGVRRPTSTTFVDIFKGYNAEVYTKIKFQEEAGQNSAFRGRSIWSYRLEIFHLRLKIKAESNAAFHIETIFPYRVDACPELKREELKTLFY